MYGSWFVVNVEIRDGYCNTADCKYRDVIRPKFITFRACGHYPDARRIASHDIRLFTLVLFVHACDVIRCLLIALVFVCDVR